MIVLDGWCHLHGAADQAGLEFCVHGGSSDHADSGNARQGQGEDTVRGGQGRDAGKYSSMSSAIY